VLFFVLIFKVKKFITLKLISMKIRLILFITFLSVTGLYAQTEITGSAAATLPDSTVTNVSNAETASDSTQLLPDHYLITQKLMWGEKGLMRNFDAFKLSPESRDKEMEIRARMITLHQVTAYATLASMLATGLVGWKVYDGKTSLKDVHGTLAGATNALYYTTAALALFSPPPMKGDPKGITPVKIHRALAIVHLSSMIATQVLSGMIESHPNLKPYHRAAAMTAFGSLFLASVVVRL